MGDRCYMTVTCRRVDAPRFEELGFSIDSPERDVIVRLVDEEANYGHAGDLPQDVPFYAEHCTGGNYGPSAIVCDGKETVEMEVGHAGGFVVGWDADAGAVYAEHLQEIAKYQAMLKQVEERFEKMEKDAAAISNPQSSIQNPQ